MRVFPYTPSLLKLEALEAIFVQRHKLAQNLVELVRESVVSDNKHYTLLIGPRGIGKTHLVSLVYHRVMELADIQSDLRIAWLREEEWGVSSFLDLVLRILRSLYEAYPEAKLEEKAAELYELSPQLAEKQAIQLLQEFLGERTLLLLMENLDDIFQGLGDDGQKKLRSFLQETGCCTIIATSQSLFNGVKLQTSPFYGFFRIRYLKDFSVDEAVALLRKIAQVEENQGLAEFLSGSEGRSRVQAVHHLAGGNPRIYVVFSEFLTRESLDDLIEPFMQMLDDLTPYYQARMSWLSPQQRKIIEVLCSRRYPMPVRDIAQKCFATPQTISSQLKDLRDKGYVVSETYGRQAFYELREPLMRFCLAVKQVRGEPIQLIVEFLRTWYSRKELEVIYQSLDEDLQLSQQMSSIFARNGLNASQEIYKSYIKGALESKADPGDDSRIDACADEIMSSFSNEDYKGMLVETQKLANLRGGDWDYGFHFVAGTAYLGLRQFENVIACFDRVLALEPDNQSVLFLQGCALALVGRYKEVVGNFDIILRLNPDDAHSWAMKSLALVQLNLFKEAVSGFQKALKIKQEGFKLWFPYGFALAQRGCYEEAIASYDEALRIDPDNNSSWFIYFNRGVALFELGRYEEAIASYEKALELNPSNEFIEFTKVTVIELKFFTQISDQALTQLDSTLKNLDIDQLSGWQFDDGLQSIFQHSQDPAQWKNWLLKVVKIFDKNLFINAITQGLTQQSKHLLSEMASQTAAEKWRDVWQELVGDRPEFQIPLRLLNAVVEYKKAPDDPRVFLSLAIEERKILQQLLGIETPDR